MRILCVDDNEDTCQLLTAMLGHSDIEAVAVSNAADALRLIGSENFSFYLIGGRPPDADGWLSAGRSAGWRR